MQANHDVMESRRLWISPWPAGQGDQCGLDPSGVLVLCALWVANVATQEQVPLVWPQEELRTSSCWERVCTFLKGLVAAGVASMVEAIIALGCASCCFAGCINGLGTWLRVSGFSSSNPRRGCRQERGTAPRLGRARERISSTPFFYNLRCHASRLGCTHRGTEGHHQGQSARRPISSSHYSLLTHTGTNLPAS